MCLLDLIRLYAWASTFAVSDMRAGQVARKTMLTNTVYIIGNAWNAMCLTQHCACRLCNTHVNHKVVEMMTSSDFQSGTHTHTQSHAKLTKAHTYSRNDRETLQYYVMSYIYIYIYIYVVCTPPFISGFRHHIAFCLNKPPVSLRSTWWHYLRQAYPNGTHYFGDHVDRTWPEHDVEIQCLRDRPSA